ncbi:hypothetical protein JCM11251_004762 [Rhodosporidiobolus azoricus]
MPRDVLSSIPLGTITDLLTAIQARYPDQNWAWAYQQGMFTDFTAPDNEQAVGVYVAGIKHHLVNAPCGGAVEWRRWEVRVPDRETTPHPCSFQHLLHYQLDMILQALSGGDTAHVRAERFPLSSLHMPRDPLNPVPLFTITDLLTAIQALYPNQDWAFQHADTDLFAPNHQQALGVYVAGIRLHLLQAPPHGANVEWMRWAVEVPDRAKIHPCSYQYLLEYQLNMIKADLDGRHPPSSDRLRHDYKEFLEWRVSQAAPSFPQPRFRRTWRVC